MQKTNFDGCSYSVSGCSVHNCAVKYKMNPKIVFMSLRRNHTHNKCKLFEAIFESYSRYSGFPKHSYAGFSSSKIIHWFTTCFRTWRIKTKKRGPPYIAWISHYAHCGNVRRKTWKQLPYLIQYKSTVTRVRQLNKRHLTQRAELMIRNYGNLKTHKLCGPAIPIMTTMISCNATTIILLLLILK